MIVNLPASSFLCILNVYLIIVCTLTLSSKSSDWKCFVNIRDIIKLYFFKKTQTIIVSFYEYTVYIMFWIMMFYDCYYYCNFLSKYHCFLQCKIIFCSKSYKESGIKIITINWNIAISCNYEWMKCCQKRKIINEWFILLRDIILLRNSQLVTSYSLRRECRQMFLKSGFVKL